MKFISGKTIVVFLFSFVLVAFVLVRCTPAKKSHVLSLLFDGAIDSTQKTANVSLVDTNAVATISSSKVFKPEFYVHKPYAEDKCKSCHAEGFSNALIKPVPELCYTCHQDFSTKYKTLHGPLNSGNCTACHDQHMAKNEKLLIRTGQEICLYCHESKQIFKAKQHELIGNKNCTECHNPHGGDDRFILVPSLMAAKELTTVKEIKKNIVDTSSKVNTTIQDPFVAKVDAATTAINDTKEKVTADTSHALATIQEFNKNKTTASTEKIDKVKPVKTDKVKPVKIKDTVHKQLAVVDKLNFLMNLSYNVTSIDINDAVFSKYIDNLLALYTKNGSVNITIIASASQVPTKAFKTNKELAIARSEKAKMQILFALKAKGVENSKVNFVKVKSIVAGPGYSFNNLKNKSYYEKYQFIKISAY